MSVTAIMYAVMCLACNHAWAVHTKQEQDRGVPCPRCHNGIGVDPEKWEAKHRPPQKTV